MLHGGAELLGDAQSPPAGSHDVNGPVPILSPAAAAAIAGSGQPTSLLPGRHTRARKVRFALVSGCTLASVALGGTAILLAMSGQVRLAALAVGGCVLADGLDGPLSRWLKVSSPFGAQLDSLADMCSFGVAAPIVAYVWLSPAVPAPILGAACVLVGVCAAVRLARFNVSPRDGQFFSGVPTTMAAAAIALSALVVPDAEPWWLASGIAVLALAMVSTFPYAKVGRIRKLPPWAWVLGLAGLLVDPAATFLLAVAAYLASGPVRWVAHRQRATTVSPPTTRSPGATDGSAASAGT